MSEEEEDELLQEALKKSLNESISPLPTAEEIGKLICSLDLFNT